MSFQLQRGLQRERRRGRGRREGREGEAGGRCREGETVKEKWKNEGLEERDKRGQRGIEGVGTKEALALLVTVPT